MNVIVVFNILIVLCLASEVIHSKRSDPAGNGHYTVKIFGPRVLKFAKELGTFSQNNSEHSYSTVPWKTPENDTIIANKPDSIGIGGLMASVRSYYLNVSVGTGGHHPGDASVEDDSKSQINGLNQKMIAIFDSESNTAEDTLREQLLDQHATASGNDCIIDCKHAIRRVNFTVTPEVTHFLSGSSLTFLCQIQTRRNAISKMAFEYEGIHFFGPVCTPNLKDEDCMHFPSISWRAVTNNNDSIYSEEITIRDIEESYSGYYSCVVKLKCCGDKGIYSTHIRRELPFPISINSFAEYRATILIIGGSIVVLFAMALVMAGISRCYYNAKPSTFRQRLLRNRALKDFPLLSPSSTDEDKMFIIT